MGISKPIVCEIGYKTYAINEFGMATAFVLVGKERGLLIDTGCGMCNMKEIVDELCPLPYDVALTHGHGDHTASMGLWDKVWLHPADWASVSADKLEDNKAMLAHYPDMMTAFGSFDAYDICPEQIHFCEHVPEMLPLEDGTVFDLGGRKVEVLHTPGHTAGEVVLIDSTVRILFSGDACNPNLGLGATSVETALNGLLHLKEKESLYDRNFTGHTGYGNSTFNGSVSETNLDDDIFILRGILDGTADVQYNDGGRFGRRAYVIYNGCKVSFDPDRLRD